MDLIIVLGSRVNGNKIHDELRRRLDTAISLTGANTKLLLSGGLTNPVLQKSEARIMMEYVISKGVPENAVMLEEGSLDTIGNGVFSMLLIKGMPIPDVVYVISSCYHMNRTEFIFRKCFGTSYNLDFSHCSHFERSDIDEGRSMGMAEKFFKNMKAGDIDSIYSHMLRTHPLYMKMEEN